MKKNKISVRIDRYRVRLFSWTFLATIILLSFFIISNKLESFWIKIIIDLIGWGFWFVLIEMEVNQWLKKKAKVYIDVK